MGLYDKCPCRYCIPPKRHPGCHSICDEKKMWDDSLKNAREAIRKEQRATYSAFSLLVEGKEKAMKRHGRKV